MSTLPDIHDKEAWRRWMAEASKADRWRKAKADEEARALIAARRHAFLNE